MGYTVLGTTRMGTTGMSATRMGTIRLVPLGWVLQGWILGWVQMQPQTPLASTACFPSPQMQSTQLLEVI